MGFGFNFFFILIVLPLTGILLLIGILSRSIVLIKFIGLLWLSIFGLIILSIIIQAYNAKILLKKEDYYGEYTVDRRFFKGKQADWQYNTFRFDIKNNDTLYFHVTENDRILRTYTGSITTVKINDTERLVINMLKPNYHILASNPTIYRNNKGFFLVFNSSRYGNMFFKKGKWKPID